MLLRRQHCTACLSALPKEFQDAPCLLSLASFLSLLRDRTMIGILGHLSGFHPVEPGGEQGDLREKFSTLEDESSMDRNRQLIPPLPSSHGQRLTSGTLLKSAKTG